MKKIYMTPSLLITRVSTETLIAVSLDKNETGADADVVLTKGDRGGRGSRSDYNVWNEDWSK